jgi:hypothetical protein
MLHLNKMAVVAVFGFALTLGGCFAPTPERVVLQQSSYFRPGCDPGFTKNAQFMHNGKLVDVIQDPCAEPSPELQSFLRGKGLQGERLMRAGRHIARNAYPKWEAGYKVWTLLQKSNTVRTRCTGIGTSTIECETSY